MRRTAPKIADNRSATYVWTQASGKAANFLSFILPFLVVKKEQAVAALEFQEHVDNSKPLFRKYKNKPPLDVLEKIYRERRVLIDRLQHYKHLRYEVSREDLKNYRRGLIDDLTRVTKTCYSRHPGSMLPDHPVLN